MARRRPVTIVQPATTTASAPFAAAECDLGGGPAEVSLHVDGATLRATWDGRRVALTLSSGGRTTATPRRRFTQARAQPDVLAVALTGTYVSAWLREEDGWVLRDRLDLGDLTDAPDVLAGHGVTAEGDRVGLFGQLGLRDVRLVTHADGSAYLDAPGRFLLTASSAGPGGFSTAHTSVWSFEPDGHRLEHRGDLFFRRATDRGIRTFGDHAVHLLREEDRWLVATSTWGDFDPGRRPGVTTGLAASTDDLTRGCHVLDTEPLHLPVDGLSSVGTWDPHLVRTDHGWLVAFVSAERFFRFHPVVAEGPALDRLRLRAADTRRIATEGVTLVHRDDAWWVLASDGRDGPRSQRAAYPVLDLDLREHGVLDAAYPSNIPWPTLLDDPALPGGPLLLGFDGTTAGGAVTEYGTHGDLVIQRPV